MITQLEVTEVEEILKKVNMGAFRFSVEMGNVAIQWTSPLNTRELKALAPLKTSPHSMQQHVLETVRLLIHAVLAYETDRTLHFGSDTPFDPGWQLSEVFVLQGVCLVPRVLSETKAPLPKTVPPAAPAEVKPSQPPPVVAKPSTKPPKPITAPPPKTLLPPPPPVAAKPVVVPPAPPPVVEAPKFRDELDQVRTTLMENTRMFPTKPDLARLRLIWHEQPLTVSPKDSRERVLARLLHDLEKASASGSESWRRAKLQELTKMASL